MEGQGPPQTWREVVERICVGCVFYPPATVDEVIDAESALGVRIQDMLRSLLLESDRVNYHGLNIVLPVRAIKQLNLWQRDDPDLVEIHMPFDHLLFFANAGYTGDLFGFAIAATGEIAREDVYLWNRLNDSRTWYAPTLEEYFEKVCKGSRT